jgi:biopolymer transport protein ExbB
MISSFNAIAASQGMGKPELLASGVSEALITTATGLTISIPAMVAYLWFVGRVDRLVIEIDAHAQQVVDCISADALHENSRSERISSKRAAA